MDCLQTYVTDVRDYVDEPASGAEEWTDERIARHISNEMKHLGKLISLRKEDFCGYTLIIPITTDVYRYEIPFGHIRKVEILKSGVTALGNNVYTVSPNNNRTEIDPAYLLSQNGEFYDGYYSWGTGLEFTTDTPDITTGNYARLYIIKALADLFAGTADATTAASTLVVADADITLNKMVYGSNVYTGYGVKIYDGTGAGQIRRITADSFSGTKHTFTLDANWDITPTGSSIYSLLPPLSDDFEDSLTMGGALRCKFRVEDKNTELQDMYRLATTTALDVNFPRNQDHSRKVRRSGQYEYPGKTIILRRP